MLIDAVDADNGGATGRSKADAPEIDGEVHLRDAGQLEPGDIVPVRDRGQRRARPVRRCRKPDSTSAPRRLGFADAPHLLRARRACRLRPRPQPAADPFRDRAVDALVTRTLTETGVPSASIAIVRDGRIVLTKAYGKASEAIPVARPDLPYQIASNSKQFTAMGLQLLEDDGKLSLDDKVSKFIPGISGGDRITIRQLLSAIPRACRTSGRRITASRR